jgi:hypothetical protein
MMMLVMVLGAWRMPAMAAQHGRHSEHALH